MVLRLHPYMQQSSKNATLQCTTCVANFKPASESFLRYYILPPIIWALAPAPRPAAGLGPRARRGLGARARWTAAAAAATTGAAAAATAALLSPSVLAILQT